MGEVRASRSVGRRPANCMACRALLRHEILLSRNLFGIGRHRRVLPLRTSPFIERSLFFDDHEEAHVSVLQPAKLSTLTAIDAGPVGANEEFVRPSWNEVLLARKARHPEGMDDIDSLKLQADISAYRNMNFIRRF